MTVLQGHIRNWTQTAANWTSNNPTLLLGEVGFESDTGRLKIGNGSTAWNSLSYFAAYTQKIHETATFPTSVAQGDASTPIYFDRAGTLLYVSAWCGTAPVTASVIVDLHKNGGSSIFTTQGNRPTISTGTTYDLSVAPDVTSITAGDRLQAQIDQLNASDEGNIGQLIVRITWVEAVS